MRSWSVVAFTTPALLLLLGTAPRASAADAAPTTRQSNYAAKAREVTAYVQKTFWDDARGYYFDQAGAGRKPDYVWRQAAAFSMLVGAARHEPKTYRPPMAKHFGGLQRFWDAKVPIPAYEPAATRGNGDDKYYDDNAWLVITFAEAFELTGDRQYLARAKETAKFVLSGLDDEGGGGIWWHQRHHDGSKNVCSNGPGAVGFLAVARHVPAEESKQWAAAARKAVDWTTGKLQDKDGLYDDRLIVATGEVKRGKLTYNSALMLRAYLDLYRRDKRPEDLEQAKRIGRAADWFLDGKTGRYRDPLKWSQFMVEADVDLYRETREEYLLERARAAADAYYATWKKQPWPDMMSNAGTARILWLLADPRAQPDSGTPK
jgi:hypothetical protein